MLALIRRTGKLYSAADVRETGGVRAHLRAAPCQFPDDLVYSSAGSSDLFDLHRSEATTGTRAPDAEHVEQAASVGRQGPNGLLLRLPAAASRISAH